MNITHPLISSHSRSMTGIADQLSSALRLLLILMAAHVFWSSPAIAGQASYHNTDHIEDLIDKNAHWQRTCRATENLQAPSDKQTHLDEKKFTIGCDAQGMYDDAKNSGNSTLADWRAVHSCANAEDDTSTLMMLYANGLGVQRNFSLAVKYACATIGAVHEVAAWVDYLSAQDENSDLSDFDVCDHAVSGYLVGLCTARYERKETQLREVWIGIFKKKLTQSELLEFQNLSSAATAFANNRGKLETDLSGSARTAFEIEARSSQLASFIALLEMLEGDKGNSLPCIDLRQMNHQLSNQYRNILDNLEPSESENETNWLSYTTITKSNVKQTQRSWLQYRDSWIRFARIRYPTLDQTRLAAYLTNQRLAQLRELAS